MFNNNVGGLATDWNNSTLVLNNAATFSINDKSDDGDEYDVVVLADGGVKKCGKVVLLPQT
ncbi:MAG: hypothetical protein R3B60_03625 [Candidatus Paceibacterota bacterium]